MYPYSSGDLLNTPQHYMYSAYNGAEFIQSWLKSRALFEKKHPLKPKILKINESIEEATEYFDSHNILVSLCGALRDGDQTSHRFSYWLPRLIKKFEVTKRLYDRYEKTAPHAKVENSDYQKLSLYIFLAEVVIRSWAKSAKSQYINCLLKLMDTLHSQSNLLSEEEKSALIWLTHAEKMIISRIANNIAISDTQPDLLQRNEFAFLSHALPCHLQNLVQEPLATRMSKRTFDFKNIVMLCGHTARSSAYIQALEFAGIKPSQTLLYGDSRSSPHSDRCMHSLNNLQFCPDLKQMPAELLAKSTWQYREVAAQGLDDKSLNREIRESQPDLIIYSGYGGQLVPESVLAIAPVLHIHSGWLPEYRGSTTLYYEIIASQACSASAILLDNEIDTGNILNRKRYQIPEIGMDVDYLYDNMIRADLLVDTLKSLIKLKNEISELEQTKEGMAYFIIHPLLKHFALLSVDRQKISFS